LSYILDDYINKYAKGTLWEIREFHIVQYSVDYPKVNHPNRQLSELPPVTEKKYFPVPCYYTKKS